MEANKQTKPTVRYLLCPPTDRRCDVSTGWIPFHIRRREMLADIHKGELVHIVELQRTCHTRKQSNSRYEILIGGGGEVGGGGGGARGKGCVQRGLA